MRPKSAREKLSEAFERFGEDGRLRVLKGDPFGTLTESTDPPPDFDPEGARSKLHEKLAEANARSRGEIL
ncbi:MULTISPECIES: hypothetical protein [Streptomyces]|jgi:hypothetical protein|uniref:Type II toxin-antitoxin system prevent-host-death family antitoxin n=2 Tax=Streptomyces TaxID=1883 RepID=A0ABN1SXF2_9ACTN|nr:MULTISPECIES: hypothetical protein [Streptomyces]MDN5382922.1 hypothetical protein [Streptomyces sp. LB8]